MTERLNDAALDRLFRAARTHSRWLDRPVDEATLRAVWDLARMGPTPANCQPARILFVVSAAAKDKLRPCLSPGNVDKTMAAPVTAIIGHDLAFADRLPTLFPHVDARAWFAGKPELTEETARRAGTLQGAYLMLAARALGLDCGPMSGFDARMVEERFFPGTAVRAGFLCNLGHGDAAALHPRNPRLAFEEACDIA